MPVFLLGRELFFESFCVWVFQADPALPNLTLGLERFVFFFCLASLFFPEQNTSFSKGQNRNREAKCSHCHLSGCNSITVLIYFCTSNGNSWCFSTSPQVHCLFPVSLMVFFSQLFWFLFLAAYSLSVQCSHCLVEGSPFISKVLLPKVAVYKY